MGLNSHVTHAVARPQQARARKWRQVKPDGIDKEVRDIPRPTTPKNKINSTKTNYQQTVFKTTTIYISTRAAEAWRLVSMQCAESQCKTP